MSSVNYSLGSRGVRLISAQEVCVKGKTGKFRFNPKYKIIGKIDISMPNMIVSASDKRKPKYKGDTNDLNRMAKGQIVEHFFDDNGKRKRRPSLISGSRKTVNKQ